MPFDQHPSTVPVDPAMRNPVSVRTRGQFPFSGDPSISSSVPAVITGYPDVARTWRYQPPLNHGTRRRHSNDNLLAERRAEGQNACENNSEQSLL
jgi:hypothetical protein